MVKLDGGLIVMMRQGQYHIQRMVENGLVLHLQQVAAIQQLV